VARLCFQSMNLRNRLRFFVFPFEEDHWQCQLFVGWHCESGHAFLQEFHLKNAVTIINADKGERMSWETCEATSKSFLVCCCSRLKRARSFSDLIF